MQAGMPGMLQMTATEVVGPSKPVGELSPAGADGKHSSRIVHGAAHTSRRFASCQALRQSVVTCSPSVPRRRRSPLLTSAGLRHRRHLHCAPTAPPAAAPLRLRLLDDCLIRSTSRPQ
jgi:hypothetical protein